MPMLSDGTVIPSFLDAEPMGVIGGNSSNFGEMALRQGEIREVIYPDDKRSISKTVVEYMVVVASRNGNGPAVSTQYPNCQVANLFGGLADKLRYTYRAQSKEPADGKVISDGSKVLLLCVNGERRRALIVGGLTEDRSAESKDDGHNLFFEFNGLSFRINKDGEARVQFRGATKINGDLDTDAGADEKNGPTTVEFLKNGNLKVYTKDDKQHLLIDHENKKADFLFDEQWNVKVNKKVTEDYGGSWECSVGSSISISAKKDISFKTTGGDWKMTASGNVKIKSSGVLTGDATDATILGKTYRQAEETLNNKLSTGFQTLTTQFTIIAGAVNGPMKIPIYGASVASGIMGPAVIQCVTAVAQMMAALKIFEGQGTTYLSTKNKSD